MNSCQLSVLSCQAALGGVNTPRPHAEGMPLCSAFFVSLAFFVVKTPLRLCASVVKNPTL